MHATLRPTTNAILIAVWAALALAAMWAQWPTLPVLAPIVGSVFGACVGALQVAAVSSARDTFRSANTAAEVRRALVATRSGKKAIQLQWIGAVALILASWKAPIPFLALLAGYAVFLVAREMVAFRAVVRLGQ
jgi:hypothetical protein